MSSKYIVVAPCGNKSYLFNESWLKYKEEKQFDLCLLFYHEKIENPSLYSAAKYFFHLKGFKYHMIHELLTSIHPEWLSKYDYFYFLDDDIQIDTRQINSMFSLNRTFDCSISQASLSQESFCSWPIFKHKKKSFCRFVGQIEVMAPLFSSEAIKKCLPSYISNRSSWGIDSVWSRLLDYPEDKMIVFDAVIMKHTLPVGGGELYQKIGVDPHEEWEAVTWQFHAKKENYREYGRLLYTDKNNNWLLFFFIRCKAFFSRKKQILSDYDIPSRVKSRAGKIFKK